MPWKIAGLVLIAVAIGLPFTDADWTTTLIVGALGIGLFFFGGK